MNLKRSPFSILNKERREIDYIKGVYKNDDALLAHLANPALGVYLEAHAELGNDLSVEFYGTVGDKVIEAMNGTGVPYKIFKTKLGYSRV